MNKTIATISIILLGFTSSFAQKPCDLLCGWWLSEDSYDQWEGQYRSLLLIDGQNENRRTFLIRMPALGDFKLLNTLSETMVNLVLTDSSQLSPVLLTLNLEANESWAMKITEQEDRFGLPASPKNLVGIELSLKNQVIRPQGSFKTLEGRLSKDETEIIFVTGKGKQLEFKRILK